jgi:rubrerythrin
MEQSTQLRLKNRTGLQMSPTHARELLETVTGGDGVNPPPVAKPTDLMSAHRSYIAEADPIGTIPPPGTAKGMLKSAVKMATGERPQVFIDKLAERAAYERGGARLYEALLAKLTTELEVRRNSGAPQGLTEARLGQIRGEEAAHFALVSECIETLGADPTAQTPSADLVGVETLGLIQAISDPRTSLAQSIHVLLSAELIDNCAWEILIEMAQGVGQSDMAQRFRQALQSEQEHLRDVRRWYTALTLGETTLV